MSLTLIIIILTGLSSYMAFRNQDVMRKGILFPYLVKHHGEYYRFISSGFLHANWMHLLFNMYVLYSFGEIVEILFQRYFGEIGIAIYLVFYIVAIVISDIPTYFKHKDNQHYASLGASGAVSAIVFASILMYPAGEIGIIFLPFYIPSFIFGAIYLFYSHYMSQKGGDHINHDAHYYGALFGFSFPILLKPGLLLNFIEYIVNWI
ncbi:MAG: rhomboid family intramembrane serine protease [Bacteroidetes bacterium]|nr:rhomboid family intramembrane serine protease [Bacteroidota bacterium]